MHETTVKSILSANNGMNIYRGCTHGCIYCDSRSSCYQMQHDFEDIEVKSNAPELLEQTLRRKRKKCMVGTGSMSDPYVHLEQQFGLTRKCLELIDRYEFGLSILTKSDRILRDLKLLRHINDTSKCVVQMTLTTYDTDLCRILGDYQFWFWPDAAGWEPGIFLPKTGSAFSRDEGAVYQMLRQCLRDSKPQSEETDGHFPQNLPGTRDSL